MRRAWKCVQGRALQDRRNSFFAGLQDQGLYKCSIYTLASTSCPCSLTDSSVGEKFITTTQTQTLLRSVAPSSSSSPNGMPPAFQRRVHHILEYCGPFVRHKTLKERNSRIDSSYGIEFFVDIIKTSGGSVSASRGLSSGYKVHSSVRVFHARYATGAAAAERDYVDTSTNIPADVVIQPSLASLELVDVTEPLSALEVELTDESGTLSHVSDLEAKLRCLRDWGLTDEELSKLRLHVPNSVRSALLKNSAKKLVEVATFLVEECGVPKLKVADALLGNAFLASSRIEDCLRPKRSKVFEPHLWFTLRMLLDKVHDRCVPACLSSVTFMSWDSAGAPRLLSHRATLQAEFRINNISWRYQATYLLSLGITKEQLARIIDRLPQILTYSMEHRVLPIQRKLIEYGLKMEDIGRAVMKYPGLLGTSINKIDRTVEFLKASGVIELGRCIARHPQILSLSLDGKVHNLMAFLKSELLLDNEIIKKTISIQPSIFTYSVENNLRPKVIYFLSIGLRRQDIGRMISVHPAIMGHSLEASIKPKIDFLVNVMNRAVDEIISFPQYLSYSLCCRIQPRYEYLAERDIFPISLSSMLSCRPDIFHKRYSSSYEPPVSAVLAGKLKSRSRQY